MDILWKSVGEVVVLRLIGDLDAFELAKAGPRIDGLIDQGHSKLVFNLNRLTFINSSVATTPREAAKTLEAVEGRSLLIAGGAEGKDLSFSPLARAAGRHARCAVFIGQTAPRLLNEFKKEAPSLPCFEARGLKEAVDLTLTKSHSGDTILFAPGCPSFDRYVNFKARGDTFRTIVQHYKGHPEG